MKHGDSYLQGAFNPLQFTTTGIIQTKDTPNSTKNHHFDCDTPGKHAIPTSYDIKYFGALDAIQTILRRDLDSMKRDDSTTNDDCPAWAADMISKILLLEVEAGTIKNISESAASEGWSTTKADELMKIAAKMDKNESDASTKKDISAEVEAIFSKVTRSLAREGHSAAAIAAMINVRIPTGCRLPYCNAEEVQAALD